MRTFQKITLNTLFSYIGRILGGLVAIISIGFITRSLGVEGFGRYSIVVAYLSSFQILADLGLYSLLTKEISQNPEKEKELVSYFFTLRMFVAAAFLFIGVVLVAFFPYSREIKFGIIFASSAFLFLSLSQIFLGIFQKYLQIYKAAIAEVVGRVVQLGFVWYFFTNNGALYQYLTALIAGSFVIFLINLAYARKLVRFKLSVSIKEWKKILKTTFPIAVSLIFTLLYFKADIILISILKTQKDVGIYSAAYKVLETIIFFPAAFIGLMLPVLSRYAKSDKKRLSKLLSRLTDITTIVALPIVAGGILVASSFVYFIGGSEFLVSALTLQILFIAIGIIFYGTLFGSTIIAMGLQKKVMKVYFLGFAFNFIANLIFIPHYSYIGAAWTTVFTEFLVTAWLIWIVKKESQFAWSPALFFKVVFATGLMVVVLFNIVTPLYEPLSIFWFLGIIVLGVGVYVMAGWMLRFFKQFNLSTPEI